MYSQNTPGSLDSNARICLPNLTRSFRCTVCTFTMYTHARLMMVSTWKFNIRRRCRWHGARHGRNVEYRMHKRVVSVSKAILQINFVLGQAYTQRALSAEKYQQDSAVAILLPFRTKTSATATTIQTTVFCLAEVKVSIFHSPKILHIDVSIHIDIFRLCVDRRKKRTRTRARVRLWTYKRI